MVRCENLVRRGLGPNWASLLLALSTLSIYGCMSPHKIPGEAPPPVPPFKESTLNAKEKVDSSVTLPSNWISYQKRLDQLVGTYIALVPNTESTDGFSVVVLDRAITDEGIKLIETEIGEPALPVYRSRVEGTFASQLSFVVGNVNIKAESLYDLTLADTAIASIPPDSKYRDQKKLGAVLAKLPLTFKDVVFVTSVRVRSLSYKEYQKYNGDGDAAYSVVKAGANYYCGNELSSVTNVIYFTGLSEAHLFGKISPFTKVFTKLDAPLDIATAPPSKALSAESVALLKSSKIYCHNEFNPGRPDQM